eukprot:2828063-Amphidinium_carterae.1
MLRYPEFWSFCCGLLVKLCWHFSCGEQHGWGDALFFVWFWERVKRIAALFGLRFLATNFVPGGFAGRSRKRWNRRKRTTDTAFCVCAVQVQCCAWKTEHNAKNLRGFLSGLPSSSGEQTTNEV